MQQRDLVGRRIPVVMDVGPAVHQRAGLRRYTERLAANLIEHEHETVDLTLFYNAHSGHQPPASLAGMPMRRVNQGQRRWRLGALASQILGSERYRDAILGTDRNRQPIYHATEHLLPRLDCPTVLTVHDLIFEHYPEYHTRVNRVFLKVAMPRFVHAADSIIAVSRQTRLDLVDLYGVRPDQIAIIHEGIDARFKPQSQEATADVRHRYAANQPYLLMVGTLEPRKNHALAMRALVRLKDEGQRTRLLISGPEGWLFEPIRRMVDELDLSAEVTFLGYAPAEDLPALYAGARCVLQPSLYEGFGFPVLEAMACGTPVICSNTGSLPEIAGAAALLVDPHDEVALAAAIRRVLNEAGLADHLRAAGLARARSFTWAACAGQTADLYRSLAP